MKPLQFLALDEDLRAHTLVHTHAHSHARVTRASTRARMLIRVHARKAARQAFLSAARRVARSGLTASLTASLSVSLSVALSVALASASALASGVAKPAPSSVAAFFGASTATLLGPAAAIHDSTTTAPVAGPAAKKQGIEILTRCIEIPQPAQPSRIECSAGQYLVTRLVPQERRWHQSNPAVGLKLSWERQPSVDSDIGSGSGSGSGSDDASVVQRQSWNVAAVNYVQDSYGKPSLMALVGREWSLLSAPWLKVNAGAAAGLWWRTVQSKEGMAKLFHLVSPTATSSAIWNCDQLIQGLESLAEPGGKPVSKAVGKAVVKA